MAKASVGNKRIAFYTLGCKVNQYESRAMAEIFSGMGYEVVPPEETADIYVINSCTVTGIADKKSRNFARRSKRMNPKALTVLAGCYAEVAGESLKGIGEIDLIVGSRDKDRLPELVDGIVAKASVHSDVAKRPVDSPPESADGTSRLAVEPKAQTAHISADGDADGADGDADRADGGGAVISLSYPRAYIKIEDGCDRYCAFCIVPYARGAVRSRALGDIVEEARQLVSRGYKELILTGVNAALYGSDAETGDARRGPSSSGAIHAAGVSHTPGVSHAPGVSPPPGISPAPDSSRSTCSPRAAGIMGVVDAISELDGDFRIRLSSLEPTVVDAAYARELVKRERLCPHLHLSLQSGSDSVLSAMGRRYTMDEYLRIVEVLKSRDPLYSITTDLIVGFPGETDEDFRRTLDSVDKVGFSKIHVFKYSRRTGTRAAEMDGQIAEQKKSERSRHLIEAGEHAAKRFREANTGTTRSVLFLGSHSDSERAQCDAIRGQSESRSIIDSARNGASGIFYEGITDNGIACRIRSKEDIRGKLLDVRM
ncbi:MAG: MiaB/RimO family radical SAM methylthiotransferase [Clostridiales Family XIII bacterium]|jgi:threonylcarbamoyladenosine tRNA methylthiotransferase MtaB|nr:MiaB/RimO family radical SAM methylthiotransferase [Clostridiales Family XIII bacterium]